MCIRTQYVAGTVTVMALLLTMTGCQGLNTTKQTTETRATANDITRVQAFWTDTVLQDNGHPIARGFAGRVHLYNRSSEESVQATGTITIFTFDDEKKTKKPQYTWEFDETQIVKIQKKTDLGWSYSFWIPWESGSDPKNCSVVVRYTSPKGRHIISPSARVRLPALPKNPDLQRSQQTDSTALRSSRSADR